MWKEKKNRWILVRCLIVTVIFALLIVFAGKLFIPYYIQDTDQNRTFYKMEKNTVDVLIAGSSTLLVGLSPLELWEDYGIVAHTRASTVQAPPVTWLNIKEAYRYQKPKVVVMGITSLFLDYDYDANEPYLRRGLDFKRLSADKLKAVVRHIYHDYLRALGLAVFDDVLVKRPGIGIFFFRRNIFIHVIPGFNFFRPVYRILAPHKVMAVL